MIPFLIILLTPLLFLAGMAINKPKAVPVLCALPAFSSFILEIQHGLSRAFLSLLFWSVLQSVLVILSTLRSPERMEKLIWKGKEYSGSMFEWIRTSRLPEGSPAAVPLSHLKQTILYCVLAIASANLLSLILGCALLNYMNYYVARLVLSSRSRLKSLILGWNPWSVLRVAAFLLLGAALGAPLVLRFRGLPFSLSEAGLLTGVAGVTADILLKMAISRRWSVVLRNNLR